MKKNIIRILILVAILGIFSPLFTTLASELNPNEKCNSAENPTNSPCVQPYTLLSPLPGLDNTEPFYPADEGALGKYLNIIIKLVIGISAVLAVVMIVMGGIEYMGSELISSKESGKEKIQNALLGLLIAMGAWALLYTINPNLLNSDITISDANVTVEINDNVPQTAVGGRYSDGRSQGTLITGQQSLPPFATLNKNECTSVGQPTSCTSTAGLDMTPLYTISNACGCNIVITGGTETWLHGAGTTHRPNSGTVDLRPTNELTRYIVGSNTAPKTKTWYKVKDGGYALYEVHNGVAHWHFNPKDRK